MTKTPSTYKLIQELSKKFDEKFEKFDSKFAKIDSRFDKIDTKLGENDSRFDKIDTNLSDLNIKFDLLRIDNGIIRSDIQKSDDKAEKRHNRVMNHIDGLAKGFKKFDEEQTILSAHSKTHTDKIEKLEKKVFGVVQI